MRCQRHEYLLVTLTLRDPTLCESTSMPAPRSMRIGTARPLTVPWTRIVPSSKANGTVSSASSGVRQRTCERDRHNGRRAQPASNHCIPPVRLVCASGGGPCGRPPRTLRSYGVNVKTVPLFTPPPYSVVPYNVPFTSIVPHRGLTRRRWRSRRSCEALSPRRSLECGMQLPDWRYRRISSYRTVCRSG